MNQTQALLDSTPPERHLQGVQGEIGAHVVASCRPTIIREYTSGTKAM
ncbi:hypothetical protein OH736_05875 [Streptomyces sp. NBC_01650]|nr:hypothetical protein OH736_05875 [Streptomyces sp. NBC_01650]